MIELIAKTTVFTFMDKLDDYVIYSRNPNKETIDTNRDILTQVTGWATLADEPLYFNIEDALQVFLVAHNLHIEYRTSDTGKFQKGVVLVNPKGYLEIIRDGGIV